MKKLVSIAAVSLALAPALFSTSAFATSPGRLANGDTLFQVRNVTTNTEYASTASATCGQTVKYSVTISNTQFGELTNVTVKAPINGTVTVSALNGENETVTSTGKATATTDKGTISYVAGTATLLGEDGTKIKSLDDSLVTTGINAGSLAGSTIEYVQYQAKVDCPVTPVTPVTPTTPTTPTTPETPVTPVTELPSTGAGDMILPALGLAAVSAAAVYAVRARRSLRV